MNLFEIIVCNFISVDVSSATQLIPHNTLNEQTQNKIFFIP